MATKKAKAEKQPGLGGIIMDTDTIADTFSAHEFKASRRLRCEAFFILSRVPGQSQSLRPSTLRVK